MNNNRLRVLLVAHELSPSRGSECAIGWNIVTRLAKYHDITVLYADGSQFSPGCYLKEINNYLAEKGPVPGLTLVKVDQPFMSRLIASVNSLFSGIGPVGLPLLYYLGYNFWQRSAYRIAKKLHNEKKFQAAHQLTQLAVREPGYLWKLGIPFFWGPTGGLRDLPGPFLRTLSFTPRMLEYMRAISNRFQFSLTPRIRSANRKASVIYSYSSEDSIILQKRAKGKISQMLDVGTHKRERLNNETSNDHKVLRGIWCGQLTYRKAPDILLKALALSQCTRDEVELKIVGSGPLEEYLLSMEKELGLKNIEWIRNVSHEEVFSLMGGCDFFIHTSLREATSSVIPEAMSVGLPVICHDAFGMSVAINDKCGIKVPLRSPEESIRGFNEAMERFVRDRNFLADLRKGVRQRSAEITWDWMAETIAGDYSEASGSFKG